MEDEAMKRAFEQWEEVSMDDNTWNEYRERRKAVLDGLAKVRESELREQDAHERGVAEGIAKGIAKGIAEGKRAAARELITEGADVKLIVRVTGLSVGEVEALHRELN